MSTQYIQQLTIHSKIPVYCNCEGAIKRVCDIPTYHLWTKTKHNYILKLFLPYNGPASIKANYHHIKAHQDDLVNLEQLSHPAQLYCECDYAAKSHLLSHLDNPQDQLLPNEPLATTIQGNKVTTNTGQAIRHHIGEQLVQQFSGIRKF